MSETTIAENSDTRQVVKFKVRRDGGHVKVRVFAGQENSPGLCGELTMRRDEWKLFRAHIDADAVGKSQCQIAYEGDVQSWLARVSDERIEEILDELNRFIVHEYEGGTEIRMGVAVPVRDVIGSDFNLDKAVDWAIQQREVCCTGGPQDGRASVELTDGTELKFVAAEKSWFVVPAEVEAVQP